MSANDTEAASLFANVAVFLGGFLDLIPGNPYAAGLPYALTLQSLNYAKLENSKGAERSALRLLEYYKRRSDTPLMDLAIAKVCLGTAMSQQGRFAESEKVSNEIIALYEQIPDAKPTIIAASLADLAVRLAFEGKAKQSLLVGNSALKIQDDAPHDGQAQLILLGMTLNNLGVAYSVAGDAAKALEMYERSLKIKLAIFGEKSKEVVTGHANVGGILLRENQLERASEHLEKSKSLVIELSLQGRRSWPGILNSCGDLHRALGRFDEAEKEILQALKLHEKLKSTKDIATAHNNLGKLHRDKKEFSKSDAHFRKALAIREKQFGYDHFMVSQVLDEYALLMRASDRGAEAELLENRAAKIKEQMLE